MLRIACCVSGAHATRHVTHPSRYICFRKTLGASEATMTIQARWTIDDLEALPHIAGERHEIIDGELYVTTQPHGRHQATSENISFELGTWSRRTSAGRVFPAPGIIYARDEAVA